MPKTKITSKQFLTVSALLVSLEGLLCLIYLLSLPSDPKNAAWLGYSANRLMLAGVIVAGLLGALIVGWGSWRQAGFSSKLKDLAQNNVRRTNLVSIIVGLLFVLATLAVSVHLYIPELYSTSYHRILPLLVFAALALFHSVVLVFTQVDTKTRGRFFWGLMFIFLAGFYISSTMYHAYEVNVDARRSDQVAWVDFSKKVYESGFRDTGSRNFMPAYAYVQAVFIDLQATVEEQFLAGKLVNIVLSVVLLAASGLIIRRHFSSLPRYVLLILIGFNLFVFKAAYYQPELLFYFVYFLIFYLSVLMLRESNWKLAVLTGLALAIGHYIKASVLPGLLAFAVAYVLKFTWDWWREKRYRKFISSWLNLAIVVVTFLVILSPYLLESKAKYGHYFYNVNTTFYVWNDNWTQALNGTRQHGDQVGWPDMPPEDIPSFQKYVREHTWGDVIDREVIGLRDAAENLLRPYGMIPYQVVYMVAAVVLMLVNRSWAIGVLRQHWALFLYAAFLFPGYYALFAWYAPISGSTARFVSGLFLPFMFAVFLLLERISDHEAQINIGAFQISSAQAVSVIHWLVLLLIMGEVFFAIPQRMMTLVF